MGTVKELKQKVLEANLSLVSNHLVISTWGNVSGYDPELGLVAIKASGVPYADMREEHMVVLDLTGKVRDSKYRPSTDTITHLIIYRHFADAGIRGVVHTHSQFAAMWAQMGVPLPCMGTTHADYFNGDIPCTRELSIEEIENGYEENTGNSIIQALEGVDPKRMPGVLAVHHAPFTWGESPEKAVMNSVVLEYIAKMAYCQMVMSDGKCKKLPEAILRKHQNRKFGKHAYYGQSNK
ncbi:MAG: L-ribulose-5-phosphate 4-epimerase AraD [Treponema sp.]|jgi:L-ribulose-5-phosphate 4-epimerase|nr:L-ribulose-5-phosphate 4-epimerase AraD [Treponema sp.]